VTSAAEDGSLRIRGRNILDLRLDGGETVRGYLTALITVALFQDGGQALKAPVRTVMAAHGMLDDGDHDRADQLIGEAIGVLAAEPFCLIGRKTDTERRLAQLQRRHSGGRR